MTAAERLAFTCECPDCGAEPGEKCHRLVSMTTMSRPHGSRVDAGKRLAGIAAVPDNPACALCGQLHNLTMVDLVESDPSLPVYCRACESRLCDDHQRIDCERCSRTAAPQGERVRLFEPAPAVMPGQLSF